MDPTKFIWLDGELVAWERAMVHVHTHSLHYGMAAFEGIRAYPTPIGAAIFRLDDHLRRLEESAKILGIEIPFSRERLADACREVVRANGLPECYLRPIAFVGEGELGIHATGNPIRVSISCWKWGAYLGSEGLSRGVRAKISSFTRNHPNAAMSKAKVSGNYVNSILAKREARDAGFDEAILLDAQGMVAEGTGENLFIVRHGRLVTPPLPNVLGGITRDTVLELAGDFGYEIEQRPFARDELYIADEAFFCGTAAEITPIREVDGRRIGAGERGPVTRRLQETYFALVRGNLARFRPGRNPRWLSMATPPARESRRYRGSLPA